MYKKNICSHYTSSRIRRYTLSYIMKIFVLHYIKKVYNEEQIFSLYIVSYKTIYTFMYKRNICCHYTSSRIRRYTLSYIMKIFVVII